MNEDRYLLALTARAEQRCRDTLDMTSRLKECTSLIENLAREQKQCLTLQQSAAQKFTRQLTEQCHLINKWIDGGLNISSVTSGGEDNLERKKGAECMEDCKKCIHSILADWKAFQAQLKQRCEDLPVLITTENDLRHQCSQFEKFDKENETVIDKSVAEIQRNYEPTTDTRLPMHGLELGAGKPSDSSDVLGQEAMFRFETARSGYRGLFINYNKTLKICAELGRKLDFESKRFEREKQRAINCIQRLDNEDFVARTKSERELVNKTLTQKCNDLFEDQDNVLDKVKVLVLNEGSLEKNISEQTESLQSETRALGASCKDLDELFHEWQARRSRYSMVDPAKYFDDNFDPMYGFTISLKKHDKYLKHFSDLLDAQSEHHEQEIKTFLANWKSVYRQQEMATEKYESVDEHLKEFREACSTDAITGKMLREKSERNCIDLAECFHELSENECVQKSGIIFEKNSRSDVELEQCHERYLANTTRYSRRFEELHQSFDETRTAIDQFEPQITAYKQLLARFISQRQFWVDAHDLADRMLFDIAQCRQLLDSHIAHFEKRRIKVEPVKFIFESMQCVWEEFQEVDRLAKLARQAVDAKSVEVRIAADLLRKCIDRRRELIQRWNAEKTLEKVSKILSTLKREDLMSSYEAIKMKNFQGCSEFIEYTCKHFDEADALHELHRQELSLEFDIFVGEENQRFENSATVEDSGECSKTCAPDMENMLDTLTRLDMIVANRIAQILEVYPEIIKDFEQSGKLVNDSEVDQFYVQKCSHKMREINFGMAQASNSVTDLGVTLTGCNNQMVAYSELVAHVNEISIEERLVANQTLVEELKLQLDESRNTLNDLCSDYSRSCQIKLNIEKLLCDAADRNNLCETTLERLKLTLEERVAFHEKLQVIQNELKSLYALEVGYILKLKIAEHVEKTDAIIRDVENSYTRKKAMGLEENCDQFEKQVSDDVSKIKSCEADNARIARELLNLPIESFCAKEHELLLRDNEIRADVHWNCEDGEDGVRCSQIQEELLSMAQKHDELFSSIRFLLPNVERKEEEGKGNFYIFEPAGSFTDNAESEFVKISNSFLTWLLDANAMEDDCFRALSQCGELKKRYEGLCRKMPKWRIPMWHQETRNLKALATKIETCLATLEMHSDDIAELKRRNDESKNEIARYAIDKINNARNHFERICLDKADTRITKDDVYKAFRTLDRLIHPHKCQLEGAKSAMQKLNYARAFVLHKIDYRI